MPGSAFHLRRPRWGICAGARQLQDLITYLQHVAAACHHFRPDLGQLHIVGLPFHQLHAQVLLKLIQLRRQRRLADETPFRRLAEMPGIRDSHQVFEIFQVDHVS